jgi:hypothetical protein
MFHPLLLLLLLLLLCVMAAFAEQCVNASIRKVRQWTNNHSRFSCNKNPSQGAHSRMILTLPDGQA